MRGSGVDIRPWSRYTPRGQKVLKRNRRDFDQNAHFGAFTSTVHTARSAVKLGLSLV
jgi:hypothetical protein